MVIHVKAHLSQEERKSFFYFVRMFHIEFHMIQYDGQQRFVEDVSVKYFK